MRFKNSILLVFLTLVLLNFFFVIEVYAYRNDWGGTESMTTSVESYRAAYYGPLVDGKRTYFGTHDWLGESSLIILRENSDNLNAQAMAFINLLYSDSYDLKMYYLLGTEMPDTLYSQHTLFISIYNCKGEMLNGESILTIMKIRTFSL